MDASEKSTIGDDTKKSTEPFKATIAIVAIIGVLVAVAIGMLIHFGAFHRQSIAVDDLASVDQATSTVAKITVVPDGPYKSWKHYTNADQRFSINVSPVVKITDYAGASQSDPSYALFRMDLTGDQTGRTIEYLHIAIFEADLQTSARYQDTARSDIYQVAPTKKDVTIAGHKAIRYYYDSDIRAAVYLIDNGARTFAITGFVHTKDPESVKNFWKGFDNTVASFTIDAPATSN